VYILIIAVDIGGTQVRVALLNEKFTLLTRKSFPTGMDSSPEESCTLIAEEIDALCRSVDFTNMRGLGISTPSIDRRTGRMINPPNLPRWHNHSLAEFFSSRLNMPVVVGNDASLAALGEHRYGAGQGVDNMVYITLSTGIGGGLIINGNLYDGKMGFAGEIGHISVDPQGDTCKCGNIGCLELYAAGPAILKTAIGHIGAGAKTSLSMKSNLSTKDIFEHSLKGDDLSSQIVEEVGKYLGKSLVSVMNMFEPEIIVFGGSISSSFEQLRPHIEKYIEHYSMAHFKKRTDLRIASLGGDSSLVGAACFLLDDFLES
jgi:glucokinase